MRHLHLDVALLLAASLSACVMGADALGDDRCDARVVCERR